MITLAGTTYNKFKDIANTIKVGDLMDLVPEPHNEYDSNAVAVYYKGLKIGYVPRGTKVGDTVALVTHLNQFDNEIVGCGFEMIGAI